jgi:hypothetical protein
LYIIMIPNATCNFMLRICKIGFLTYIYWCQDFWKE